jgi:hypothetical protein
MSAKFFLQDRAQIVAVCDFKPFGNEIDETPSDSETLLKLRATLRQLAEISISENIASYQLQGDSLAQDFDGNNPYTSMLAGARAIFGSDLDGGGQAAIDISDLNTVNSRIERAIRSMDFNRSQGLNNTLKNKVQQRVDDLVPSNPTPYFVDVKFTVSDYITNLGVLLADAGFEDGDVSKFSSTKTFYHIVDLLGQLMNSSRPRILDAALLGARVDDSDVYTFRKTVEYNLINPVIVTKTPRANREVPSVLFSDIQTSPSGILSDNNFGPPLTGAEAFDDEYTLAQHLLAVSRELATSAVVGKYEDELASGSPSSIAIRASNSGLIDTETDLNLNRQVTTPKTLESDALFDVKPMVTIGPDGSDEDFFPDRFLAVSFEDEEFPEYESREGTLVDGKAQASIFEQLDVNVPEPVGLVQGTRNYLFEALLQGEIPSIRALESGNLSDTANRITAVENAFQSSVEDYVTYIGEISCVSGLANSNNLDPVRVSKKLFCNQQLASLLKKSSGFGIYRGDPDIPDDPGGGGGGGPGIPGGGGGGGIITIPDFRIPLEELDDGVTETTTVQTESRVQSIFGEDGDGLDLLGGD